jgi:hypothetical protein
MRINHTKRILMIEADGSPGGGAAPALPAEPPAESAAPAPAPAVSLDQVKSLIGEQLGGFKNGFFAELRKAGLLGKEKSSPDPTATPSASNSAAAPAMTGLTEAELDARLEQERVITKAQVENKLSDAAVKRMKSALRTEKPEDVGAWTSAYLADLGLVRTNNESSTTVTPSAPVLPNTAPISDRGSPAPAGAVGWRYELSNPIGMSAAARAQMDAELGADKARRMRIEAAQTQAEKMRVTFGPKG